MARCGSARGMTAPAGWLWTPAAGESSTLPEKGRGRRRKSVNHVADCIFRDKEGIVNYTDVLVELN